MAKEKEYMVYCHESPSGKRYVGITCRGEIKRWCLRGEGYKSNKHLWNSICKWGWDNFEHYILFEGLTYEQAASKEVELIATWNTMNPKYGYNHDSGGNSGKHLSEETKDKLRKSLNKYYETHDSWNKGIPKSEGVKRKISEAHKGMKWSEKKKKKELARRKANPRKQSEETRAKISKSNKESEKRQRKTVCQYDLNGNYIQTFRTSRDASTETGTNRQQLIACCEGCGYIANGYMWRYVDENGKPPKVEPYKKPNAIIHKTPQYLQYSLDGKFLSEYSNSKQLEENGFRPSNVQRCCNHIRKTYKGFIWEYKEEGVVNGFNS